MDPDLPPGDVSTLDQVLVQAVAHPRFRAALVSAFAIVALVAALATYLPARRALRIDPIVALRTE